MTDLHEAADMGNIELIQAAIRRGCDVNMADESFGGRFVDLSSLWSIRICRTPLHLAAGNGHVEAVRLLLRMGADPTLPMETGFTPAHCAAETGRQPHFQRVFST